MTRLLPRTVALAGLLGVSAFVLYLVGRPLGSDDLWWHLAYGRAHLEYGPFLTTDPLLHSAELPPSNGAWLFQIFTYSVDRIFGFHGLRLLHVLSVAGIGSLAWVMFRRASGSVVLAHAATAAFLTVSWFRLFQLRPHLLTIAAAIGLYRLVIEPRDAASWQRVAGAAVLIAVWANVHPAFLVGPAFLLAALLGIALGFVLERFGWRMPAGPTPNVRALRIAAALVGGVVLAVINPRGLDQHRAFFSASKQDTPELGTIHDEWAHFSFFDLDAAFDPTASGPLAWLLTCLLALASIAVAYRAARQRRLDPVLLGLSAASFVAIGVAVRFQWMIVFPLLFLATSVRLDVPLRRWLAASLSGVLAIGLAFDPAFGARVKRLPSQVSVYIERPFDGFKHFPTCVGFLHATKVEGQLFNTYSQGGFLGYWLAPALRTIVNGTLNYPARIEHDVGLVTQGAAESLEALDRNGVDVFVGTGLPMPGSPDQGRLYTTTRLDRAAGWIPVFRSLRCSVSIRDDASASAKLDRIADYYARALVPFDRTRGFDAAEVIRRAPDFAERHALLPRNAARLREISRGANFEKRRNALGSLATNSVLVGAYTDAIRYD
ncbi:MAG: hypothetical protein VX246_08895, partial [Myxococcota bacterium]|nr:hypothetical protein [Myxococcota bacterium]